MIQNHKLKYENGEEVLYLYLDFSYEFSKELGEFSSSIFSSIKNYLKRLKKEFNGKKVVIVCSGIIIATLSLNVGMMKENKVTANDDILYITSVHFENPNIEKAKIEEKEEEVKNEQNASDSVQKETKVEKQKETNESSHQNKPTSTKKIMEQIIKQLNQNLVYQRQLKKRQLIQQPKKWLNKQLKMRQNKLMVQSLQFIAVMDKF